jgi:hypothetical protein
MSLTPEEREILRSLSEPLERDRRPAFLQEAVKRIEETSPNAIGAGLVHRIGRATRRDFYDPPQDLRQGRLGPRGPRS